MDRSSAVGGRTESREDWEQGGLVTKPAIGMNARRVEIISLTRVTVTVQPPTHS